MSQSDKQLVWPAQTEKQNTAKRERASALGLREKLKSCLQLKHTTRNFFYEKKHRKEDWKTKFHSNESSRESSDNVKPKLQAKAEKKRFSGSSFRPLCFLAFIRRQRGLGENKIKFLLSSAVPVLSSRKRLSRPQRRDWGCFDNNF